MASSCQPPASTPRNSWRGCAAGLSKSWPYFRIKIGHFPYLFTWPLKFISVFRLGYVYTHSWFPSSKNFTQFQTKWEYAPPSPGLLPRAYSHMVSYEICGLVPLKGVWIEIVYCQRDSSSSPPPPPGGKGLSFSPSYLLPPYLPCRGDHRTF